MNFEKLPRFCLNRSTPLKLVNGSANKHCSAQSNVSPGRRPAMSMVRRHYNKERHSQRIGVILSWQHSTLNIEPVPTAPRNALTRPGKSETENQ